MQESQAHAPWCPLQNGHTKTSFILIAVYDNTCKLLANWETHPSYGAQGYWRSLTWECNECPWGFYLLSLQCPLQVKKKMCVHQSLRHQSTFRRLSAQRWSSQTSRTWETGARSVNPLLCSPESQGIFTLHCPWPLKVVLWNLKTLFVSSVSPQSIVIYWMSK